jgi:hypothetical protein
MFFPDLPTLTMHKQSSHKKKGKSFKIMKNSRKVCKFCSYQYEDLEQFFDHANKKHPEAVRQTWLEVRQGIAYPRSLKGLSIILWFLFSATNALSITPKGEPSINTCACTETIMVPPQIQMAPKPLMATQITQQQPLRGWSFHPHLRTHTHNQHQRKSTKPAFHRLRFWRPPLLHSRPYCRSPKIKRCLIFLK